MLVTIELKVFALNYVKKAVRRGFRSGSLKAGHFNARGVVRSQFFTSPFRVQQSPMVRERAGQVNISENGENGLKTVSNI